MTTSHNRSHPLKGIISSNDDPNLCAVCSVCIVDRQETSLNNCCGAAICRQCWPQPVKYPIAPCPLCHSSGASRASIGRLKKHAKSGRPWAQFALGVCYSHGLQVKQSVTDGRRWYEKAAKQNHPDAAYSIGSLYLNGQGCDVDLSKAREFFQRGMEWDGGVSRAHREADGLILVAASYLQSNLEDRCERALSILLPLTGTDPDNSDASAEARFRVAQVRFEVGNLQSAYSWYCSVATAASAHSRSQDFIDTAAYNAMLCCTDGRLSIQAPVKWWCWRSVSLQVGIGADESFPPAVIAAATVRILGRLTRLPFFIADLLFRRVAIRRNPPNYPPIAHSYVNAQLRFWARLAKKRSISGNVDLCDRREMIEELVRIFRELRLLRDTCGGCGAAFEGKDRKFCRGCRTYCYCSHGCQKLHWNRKEGGHREDCKAATELKRKLREAKMQAGVSH